jgi:hypothetical protein
MGDVRTKVTIAKLVGRMADAGIDESRIQDVIERLKRKKGSGVKLKRSTIKTVCKLLEKDKVCALYKGRHGKIQVVSAKYVVINGRWNLQNPEIRGRALSAKEQPKLIGA